MLSPLRLRLQPHVSRPHNTSRVLFSSATQTLGRGLTTFRPEELKGEGTNSKGSKSAPKCPPGSADSAQCSIGQSPIGLHVIRSVGFNLRRGDLGPVRTRAQLARAALDCAKSALVWNPPSRKAPNYRFLCSRCFRRRHWGGCLEMETSCLKVCANKQNASLREPSRIRSPAR